MDAGDIAARIVESAGATKSRVIIERLQALCAPENKKSGRRDKPYTHTLNAEANPTRNRRGTHSRH
jgi:hypothetical protein